nr:unnamed protein product [Callosobruchus analis]
MFINELKKNIPDIDSKDNHFAKQSSEIWNHFNDLGENKIKCVYCSQILKVSNRSSGNLIRHVKTKHVGIPICRNETRSLTKESNDVFRSPTMTERDQDCTLHCDAGSISGSNPQRPTSTTTQNVEGPVPKAKKVQNMQTELKQSSIAEFTSSFKPVSLKKSKEFDQQ